ncbi:hypothetical protein J0X14_04485 [Muricauda sp. CAU 1633]|uniref:hypothetical protein n=1 Tax=Allomuricauda sp. CAU 1633 TaxID=2816036 RepID=UPI001A8F6E45|nr:hypothetical protein [Muricauda sp. CAU 1633]MBO0321546.1 hypothetical protein [Muricauda sp. CAU 1633]
MEPRTSKSYQEAVLEKYKREKGGEMRGYLAKPTCSQIRDACIYLLGRRNEKNDDYILNRFFEFKSNDNKQREIETHGIGKFKSIEKFLKGKIKTTSTKNINLISWLIDFHPRPYEEYSKSNNSNISESPINPPISKIIEEAKNIKETDNTKESTKPSRRKLIITISISFAAILATSLILKNQIPSDNSNSSTNLKNDTQSITREKCMTWADTIYVEVSCTTKPYSKFGTAVEPLDPVKLKNFKKVEVTMSTNFFTEDGKPIIWYFKNRDEEIEYFTSPGLHPITGKTLDEITEYIIEKYVPTHIEREGSFIQ